MSAEEPRMEPNGEQTAGNSAHDSLGSTSHIRRVLQNAQSTAQPAAAISADAQPERSTEGELRKRTRSKTPRAPRHSCETCGMGFVTARNLQLHTDSHNSDDAFVCSLCGIRKSKYQTRNGHERSAHKMERHPCDKNLKEAIQIPSKQRPRFRQVGTNVEAVQLAAVPSKFGQGRPAMLWKEKGENGMSTWFGSHSAKRPRRSSSAPRTSADKSETETSDSDDSECEAEEDGEDEDEAQADEQVAEPPTPAALAAHEQQQVVPELPPVQPIEPPTNHWGIDAWYVWMQQKEAKAENAQKELHARIRMLEAEAAEKSVVEAQKVVGFQSKIIELEAKCAEELRARAGICEENEDLHEKIDKLESTVARLEVEIEEMRKKSSEAEGAQEAAVARLKRKNEDLQVTCKELQTTVAHREAQCEALRKKARDAEEATAKERARLERKTEKLKTKWKEQEDRDESRIQKLEKHNREQQEELETAAAEAAAKLADFQKRADGQQAENVALASTRSALIAECAKLLQSGVSAEAAADLLAFARRNEIPELAAQVLQCADRWRQVGSAVQAADRRPASQQS